MFCGFFMLFFIIFTKWPWFVLKLFLLFDKFLLSMNLFAKLPNKTYIDDNNNNFNDDHNHDHNRWIVVIQAHF
jgi:hypothetical protein